MRNGTFSALLVCFQLLLKPISCLQCTFEQWQCGCNYDSWPVCLFKAWVGWRVAWLQTSVLWDSGQHICDCGVAAALVNPCESRSLTNVQWKVLQGPRERRWQTLQASRLHSTVDAQQQTLPRHLLCFLQTRWWQTKNEMSLPLKNIFTSSL